MNSTHPEQWHATPHRAVIYSGAIEREEMPSMGRRVVTRSNDFAPTSGFGNTWDTTLPADFDVLPPSQPFRETLSGQAMREVTEPDVFQHFFGAAPVIEVT